MIQDATLRALFKAESEEHLQQLDDNLLRLEKSPDDQSLLDEAFREAHSLKGAARMLGLTSVQAWAHKLEEPLNTARRAGHLAMDSLAELTQNLQQLRNRVTEALGEKVVVPHGGGVLEASAKYQAKGSTNSAFTAPPSTTQPDANISAAPMALPGAQPHLEDASGVNPAHANRPPGTPAPISHASEMAGGVAGGGAGEVVGEVAGATATTPFKIELVRVDTQKLDALMALTGELAVTRTRISGCSADLDMFHDMLSTLARDPALAARLAPLEAELAQLHVRLADESARLDASVDTLSEAVRAVRLLPLADLFRLFPRLVRDLAAELKKEVELCLEGEEIQADKRILEAMKDPLMHMLRNAIAHGIELPEVRVQAGKPRQGQLRIRASLQADRIVIEVADDGRGLDLDAIRRAAAVRGIASEAVLAGMQPAEVNALIFSPGLSTAAFATEIAGRGVGMDVVRTNVEDLNGTLEVDSSQGKGTRITARLPRSLSSLRVLLVEADGHTYGLPADAVSRIRLHRPAERFSLEGRQVLLHEGLPVPVACLPDLLELPGRDQGGVSSDEARPCVFMTLGTATFGVFVNSLDEEQEIVVKPLGDLFPRVRNVTGACILKSGDICMVLNPADLFSSLARDKGGSRVRPSVPALPETQPNAQASQRKRILLAEDSITTRAQEIRILEGAGYAVTPAANGLDAFRTLMTQPFDAVVSDINMPRMDGLELTERIRRIPKFAELPIILVTSLATDEDRQHGLEAGANAYITKPEFDQRLLLECLQRFVG